MAVTAKKTTERAARKTTRRGNQAQAPIPPVQAQTLDVYAVIRSFALSSLDDKIFPDYLPFVRSPARIADQQRVQWRFICDQISRQKSWVDEGKRQMMVGGKEFPGTDHLRVVEQVAADLQQSAESIFWQVDAFKGRNGVVAGRKVSKCIQDGDWQRLAELLTIDSRYKYGARMQSQWTTVASNSPVCDAIDGLACRYFAMIVDQEEKGVEWVTTGARSEEGVFVLSTPFLVPQKVKFERVDSLIQA